MGRARTSPGSRNFDTARPSEMAQGWTCRQMVAVMLLLVLMLFLLMLRYTRARWLAFDMAAGVTNVANVVQSGLVMREAGACSEVMMR